MKQDEGKTPEPAQTMECPGDGALNQDGKPIMYRHAWSWIWVDGPEGRVWTDRMRCDNCKTEKQSSRREGDVQTSIPNRGVSNASS